MQDEATLTKPEYEALPQSKCLLSNLAATDPCLLGTTDARR